MRGANRTVGHAAAVHDRFIPTCVGLMSTDGETALCVTVHPHVRGANASGALPKVLFMTVHPHVRGANVAAYAY